MKDKDFNVDDIINEVNANKDDSPDNNIKNNQGEERQSPENSNPSDSSGGIKLDLSMVEDIVNDGGKTVKADEAGGLDREDFSADNDKETEFESKKSSNENKNIKNSFTVKTESKKQKDKNGETRLNKSEKNKKRKKKSKVNTSIFGGVIVVMVILTVSMVLAVGGISIGMEYWGIGKTDNDISFNIPKGSSNSDIADLLKENGIIENKSLFMLALKLEKPETIYPGDIKLQPSMGYSDVIDELSTMRESYKTVTITFTEGENLLEVAKKLEEAQVCSADDFLFEFNKDQGYDFEKDINENSNTFYRMEGYFFPDTYDFYIGDTAYNVTRIIREHFESKLTNSIKNKMKEKKMTLNEVMTLASIVQLEANSAKEMPKVASVFLNRLDDQDTFPMLQSDTTTNYINDVIKTQGDNQASIKHYTEGYDTYACKGLPAGPICNPGMDAINAVLNPEKTDYYYFCNNLKTGESYFAKTLEEHEKNLEKAGLV